ncbi:hypothetical protein GFPCMMHI_05974 [Ensifer adhaerens]|nr:hypothetical protein [Ensifer adhaerens]
MNQLVLLLGSDWAALETRQMKDFTFHDHRRVTTKMANLVDFALNSTMCVGQGMARCSEDLSDWSKLRAGTICHAVGLKSKVIVGPSGGFHHVTGIVESDAITAAVVNNDASCGLVRVVPCPVPLHLKQKTAATKL